MTCVCTRTREMRGPKRYCFCRVGIRLGVSYCYVDLLSKNPSRSFSYNIRKLKPPRHSGLENKRFTVKNKKLNNTNKRPRGRRKRKKRCVGSQFGPFEPLPDEILREKITRKIQPYTSRVECVGHHKHE